LGSAGHGGVSPGPLRSLILVVFGWFSRPVHSTALPPLLEQVIRDDRKFTSRGIAFALSAPG
jgi:hypothetical protein